MFPLTMVFPTSSQREESFTVVLCISFPTLWNAESRTVACEREVAGTTACLSAGMLVGGMFGDKFNSTAAGWVTDAVWVVGIDVGTVVEESGCRSCLTLEGSTADCGGVIWSHQGVFRRVIPRCESENWSRIASSILKAVNSLLSPHPSSSPPHGAPLSSSSHVFSRILPKPISVHLTSPKNNYNQ